MFKSLLLALSLVSLAAPAALAQYESSNTGTDNGRYSYKTGSARAYGAGKGYELRRPGDNEGGTGYQPSGPSDWTEQGWGDTTKNNGFVHGNGNEYGPDMKPLGFSYGDRSGETPMSRLGSGAATGAPVILGGYNTKYAPSNLAMRTQYGGLAGTFKKLPETKLDSFVKKAADKGQAWMIYGDEGTFDKPPLDDFHYIFQGIEDPDNLSTGHKTGGNTPSAWGTPQKYNQPNNSPIYGYNGW